MSKKYAGENTIQEVITKTKALVGDLMTKTNPTGTGAFSINRKANTQIGNYSHAEGYNGTATETSSHAEGSNTTASSLSSHAEGEGTTASGAYSHAEGYNTTASGAYSHAGGYNTTASGSASHAEGGGTVAQRSYQNVFGAYNVLDTTGTATSKGKYIEIVGKGTSSARSNARTLDWSGNEELAGTLTASGIITSGNLSDGTNSISVANIANKNNFLQLSGGTMTGDLAFTNSSLQNRNASIGINSNDYLQIHYNPANNGIEIMEHRLLPTVHNDCDLGGNDYLSSRRWFRNLYLAGDARIAGNLTDGTNSISIAQIVAKQDALTFDTTPTANSTNPVTSGGIKTALDGKMEGSVTNLYSGANTTGSTITDISGFKFLLLQVKIAGRWYSTFFSVDTLLNELTLYNQGMIVGMGVADDFGTVIIKVNFTSATSITVTYGSSSTAGFWVNLRGVN